MLLLSMRNVRLSALEKTARLQRFFADFLVQSVSRSFTAYAVCARDSSTRPDPLLAWLVGVRRSTQGPGAYAITIGCGDNFCVGIAQMTKLRPRE